jgi:hypothetical protein
VIPSSLKKPFLFSYNTDRLDKPAWRKTYLLGLKLLEMRFKYTTVCIYTKLIELFVRRGVIYLQSYQGDRFWRKENQIPVVRYVDYSNLIQKLEPVVQARRNEVEAPLGDKAVYERPPASVEQHFLKMAKKGE